MLLNRIIAGAASLVLAAGLYGLLGPIKIVTDDVRADCGSSIAPNYTGGFRTECDAARDDRNAWSIPVTIAGAIGLAVAIALTRRARRQPKKP